MNNLILNYNLLATTSVLDVLISQALLQPKVPQPEVPQLRNDPTTLLRWYKALQSMGKTSDDISGIFNVVPIDIHVEKGNQNSQSEFEEEKRGAADNLTPIKINSNNDAVSITIVNAKRKRSEDDSDRLEEEVESSKKQVPSKELKNNDDTKPLALRSKRHRSKRFNVGKLGDVEKDLESKENHSQTSDSTKNGTPIEFIQRQKLPPRYQRIGKGRYFYNKVVKRKDSTDSLYYFVVFFNSDEMTLKICQLESQGTFTGKRDGRTRWKVKRDSKITLEDADKFEIVPTDIVGKTALVSQETWDILD